MKFNKDQILQKYSNILTLQEIKELEYSNEKIKKYLSWKQRLDRIQYKYTLQDFINSIKLKNNNPTNSLGLEYYKENYGSMDYLDIWQKLKKEIITKRGSPYDVANISKKHGISTEDAINLVNDHKKRTSGSKDNYIRKYGAEEGEIRYRNFVEKSKSTKQNYKNRFGDDWENRWNHFMATRDSSSLQYWISKLGEVKGTEKFKLLQTEFAKASSLNHYLEKYGEEGASILEKTNLSKGKTLDYYRQNNYSEEFINNLRMKKSPIFNNLKKIYGEEEAKKKYLEYKQTRLNPLPAAHMESKSKYLVFRGGCVSKTSNKFFEHLEKYLERKLQYGQKKKELMLFDSEDKTCYFYDCYDEKTNTIIEFNGSAYHANEKLSEEERLEWCNPWGRTWLECKKREETKHNLAVKMGYKIITVWDYEVYGKNRTLTKIIELGQILNENQKDN